MTTDATTKALEQEAERRRQQAVDNIQTPLPSHISLDWQGLVNQIKEKGNEDTDGKFLVTNKKWIVSDPDLLRGIFEARKSDHPLIMIGRWGTGKNIVLELINRGTKRRNYEFQDLNLNIPEKQLLAEYFGTEKKPGVVERNDGALIHFDIMEELHDKPFVVDKILTLIEKGKLLRSDGTTARLDIRIVGGTKIDPESLRHKSVSSSGISLLLILVDRLATNLTIRTKRIAEMPDRIPTLITEQFATLYLNEKFSETELNKVTSIPREIISVLQKHEWTIDKDFYEFTQMIQNVIRNGNWSDLF
jgi:DNA-binding NtrC family response regulator